MQFTNNPAPGQRPQRYRWPWFVLGAVVLGILLAILWVSFEVSRTRRQQPWNQPLPGESTNR